MRVRLLRKKLNGHRSQYKLEDIGLYLRHRVFGVRQIDVERIDIKTSASLLLNGNRKIDYAAMIAYLRKISTSLKHMLNSP